MSLPIVEEIALVIADRVAEVTTDNGYYVNVPTVHRPGRNPTQSIVDNLVVLTMGDADRNDDLSPQGSPPGIAWNQQFHLLCYLKPDDTDDTPMDTLMSVFAADVMKAVCTPAASWWTFDNNAVIAQWQSFQRMENDGTFDGFVLTLLVIYRTNETDPYTVR